MPADRSTIALLHDLIEQTDQLVADLRASGVALMGALPAAEEVAADLRYRRQAALTEMMLSPIGEC